MHKTIVKYLTILGCLFVTHSYSQSEKSIFVQKKINDISSNTTLKIEKGTYHFYPENAIEKTLFISNHDQTNPKKVIFYLENLKNITIDGQGSLFIFHGTTLPFVIKNCKNITLKNISVDFETPHLRQLKIISIDKDLHEGIAEIYPPNNYKIENDQLFLTGEDYSVKPEEIMSFQPNKRLAYKRADRVFAPSKVTEIRPNVLKIQGWKELGEINLDDRLVLRPYKRPTPAIFVDYSQNITLKKVKIHYAYGMGLLAQLTRNITLDQFEVSLKQTDDRFFTTQADATHFSGCKGVIKSENGLYEAMADDAINVHGTYLKIIKIINEKTVVAKYMHPQSWGFLWGEVGDKVQFVASKTMEIVGNKTYKIQSIKPTHTPLVEGAKEFEISFSAPIPSEIFSENTFGIENLTWTPKVIFKNNMVRNNRARGALFSTPKKVICQNNIFDHTHGAAILLCGDCNGWFETGACRNVVIKNNTFVNALTANYQFTNAIISIYPEIPDLDNQKSLFHSGITIKNNVFETFDNPILYAKSTKNLTFKNNKILKNKDFLPFHWNTEPFLFEKVKDVKILKNDFYEGNTKMNLPSPKL